jgi:hypothetical protein
LIERVSKDSDHAEIGRGDPVGNEVWQSSRPLTDEISHLNRATSASDDVRAKRT